MSYSYLVASFQNVVVGLSVLAREAFLFPQGLSSLNSPKYPQALHLLQALCKPAASFCRQPLPLAFVVASLATIFTWLQVLPYEPCCHELLYFLFFFFKSFRVFLFSFSRLVFQGSWRLGSVYFRTQDLQGHPYRFLMILLN